MEEAREDTAKSSSCGRLSHPEARNESPPRIRIGPRQCLPFGTGSRVSAAACRRLGACGILARPSPVVEGVLRVWALRLDIQIAVERILAWPELDCSGTPEVYGAPLPLESPAPQAPPARGTSPRINGARAARAAARLPDVLLGWGAADGFPLIVPVL